MAGRLARKAALVTAAGQGIGRATAEAFRAEGARVVATDLAPQSSPASATPTAAPSTSARPKPSRPWGATWRKTSGPSTSCSTRPASSTTAACWIVRRPIGTSSLDLNVKSMNRAIRAFLPGMLARGAGSIVNVASGASSVRGIPNRYAYGATKAAVVGLSKAVAADFIARGIRCNAIHPGTVESPSLDARIAALAAATGRTGADVRGDSAGRQPMGRLGTAHEVAMLAVYLASDESRYTTDAIHLIDGGFSL